jgi:kynurenine--oxoglutarate transaminase/cysteine-S-conjugate beta-lyase/glutamine--phenylpyruvate transaminase
MIKALGENANQYTRSAGHPPLVQNLAKKYSKIMNRTINPETEIVVGVGASQTLHMAM